MGRACGPLSEIGLWRAGLLIPPPAYVYLLRSLSTGKFYLGWTTDFERRLNEHNSGKSAYTQSRGPWKLVGYEVYQNSQEAKTRERTLKRCPRMLALFKKRLLSHPTTCQDRDRQVVG